MAATVKLVPLTRNNWERAIELQPAEDQRDFMPSVLHSIAQSRFETSDLYGIYLEGTMVGFAMVAYFSLIPWVTRILIDAPHQGKGYGREALAALIYRLLSKPGVSEIRTTVAMRNATAEYLFHSLGFERTGELDGREIVMRLEVKV
jgi:diamine N-acetyltransferase